MAVTKYKYDPKKGFVTGSGRRISKNYRVGYSRTKKTILVYNKKGRVMGRVSNAKMSPFFKTSKEIEDMEFTDGVKAIHYHGASGETWRQFQEDHLRTWGYEYH